MGEIRFPRSSTGFTDLVDGPSSYAGKAYDVYGVNAAETGTEFSPRAYGATISGILTGGVVTINGGDAAKFDVAAGTGIIKTWTTVGTPTWKQVSWDAMTAIVVTGLATDLFTSLMIDADGDLVQVGDALLTRPQFRQNIVLQALVHPDNTTITSLSDNAVQAYEPIEAVLDYIDSLGPNNSGNRISANGANLTVDRSSGLTTLPFINRLNDPQSPAAKVNASDTAASFFYSYRDGSGYAAVSATEVDLDQWDNNGTLTAVSTNKWTIQRWYWFGQSGALVATYGQVEYNSQALAEAKIITEAPDINPLFRSEGTYVTGMAVKKGLTVLNTSETTFQDILGFRIDAE